MSFRRSKKTPDSQDGGRAATSEDKASRTLSEKGIQFLRMCMKHTEACSIDKVGIYRSPGSVAKKNELIKEALAGNVMSIDSDKYNVNVVTSALKSYLSSLEDPLLTTKLYREFLKISESKDDSKSKAAQIKKLLKNLPDMNYKLLDELISHLCRVSSHKDSNKMDPENLAVCFGPCLMRSNDASHAEVLKGNEIVRVLIENYADIFDRLFDSSSSPAGSPQKRSAFVPSKDIPAKTKYRGPFYIALYNCVGDHPDELSFSEDAVLVEVVESPEVGWFVGKCNGEKGYIPENYVDVISEEEALRLLGALEKPRSRSM